MGDTIGTQGMNTVAPDKGYDRRHWRSKNSTGWNTLRIESEEAIILARQRMGVSSIFVNHLNPITFLVEPDAEKFFVDGWDTNVQTGDARFLEILRRNPCPVYLKRGVNQILAHKPRK